MIEREEEKNLDLGRYWSMLLWPNVADIIPSLIDSTCVRSTARHRSSLIMDFMTLNIEFLSIRILRSMSQRESGVTCASFTVSDKYYGE